MNHFKYITIALNFFLAILLSYDLKILYKVSYNFEKNIM